MTQKETEFLALVMLGHFRVDAQGRIWRLYRMVGSTRGPSRRPQKVARRRAERSVSQRGGYLRVMFQGMTKRRTVSAHRIVWMIHNHREIPAGLEVNHKDGKKQNNHPSNLEVVTRSANTKHAIRHLDRIIQPRATPGAKLTFQQVYEIRQLWAEKAMSLKELAAHFNVCVQSIQGIIYRKTWKFLPEQ